MPRFFNMQIKADSWEATYELLQKVPMFRRACWRLPEYPLQSQVVHALNVRADQTPWWPATLRVTDNMVVFRETGVQVRWRFHIGIGGQEVWTVNVWHRDGFYQGSPLYYPLIQSGFQPLFEGRLRPDLRPEYDPYLTHAALESAEWAAYSEEGSQEYEDMELSQETSEKLNNARI